MITCYKNCVLLDGTRGMTARPHMSVLVEDDRIVRVCDDSEVSGDVEFVELGGMYLLPGLINLHIHLPSGGKPKKKQTDNARLVKLLMSNAVTRYVVDRMCESYARTELMSGCTTVRTVGGVLTVDSRIRDRINRNEIKHLMDRKISNPEFFNMMQNRPLIKFRPIRNSYTKWGSSTSPNCYRKCFVAVGYKR